MGRGRRVGLATALLVLPLVLGVANAGGRTLAVTTVTVQVIGKGTVTSAPAGLNCGNGATTCYLAFSGSGNVTLTATPATDWTFDSWNNCPGVPVGNTCEVPVNGNAFEVTANFSGPPTGTSTLSVTYSGEGNVIGGDIDCGSAGTDCTWTVLTGSTLTVLEAPDDGNIFSGWSGACDGTNVACTVFMDGDRSINATWKIATETKLLTLSVSGGGRVTGGDINCPPTCTATVPLNSSVTLTATADPGYTFQSWGGTGCSGSVPTCVVTMDADKTVSATFAATPELTVSVTGNGNVSGALGAINCGLGGNSCSATITLGQSVTLTATPAIGATFMGWSGACGGTATTCTVLMNASKSVSATFSSGTVPLTVSVSGPGTVTGVGINCGNGATACTANQALNASIILTATPASGATFNGWSGACSGAATTCSVSMTSAKSVSATFSTGGSSTFLLSVSVTGSGTVAGGAIRCGIGATTCGANMPPNSTVVLRATPAAGARFIAWGGVCSGTTTTCTVTMNAAMAVTATFTRVSSAALTSLGAPRIQRSGSKFLVTLRFRTTQGGTARVRGLRAGRVVTTLSRRVAPGARTIGPFRVSAPGLYTFELQLGGRTIRWRTCLGRCGAAAPGPDFVLTRETPTTTRSGDVWSVTLRLRANLISDARARAYLGTRLLTDKHFLARAGKIAVGPFLLGPGRYTVRLTATDPYGRVRTLTWIVSLAR